MRNGEITGTTDGPKPTSAVSYDAAVQPRQTCHWCIVQHFVGSIVGRQDKIAVRCRRILLYHAGADSRFISGNLPLDNRYAA